MRKILLAAAAALTLGVVGTSGAQAAPLSPAGGLLAAAGQLGAVETVGFRYGGHRYCWSFFGWRGPGWYQCGYSMRRGHGWGGPAGWRGWRHPTVRPHTARPRIHGPSRSHSSSNRGSYRHNQGRR